MVLLLAAPPLRNTWWLDMVSHFCWPGFGQEACSTGWKMPAATPTWHLATYVHMSMEYTVTTHDWFQHHHYQTCQSQRDTLTFWFSAMKSFVAFSWWSESKEHAGHSTKNRARDSQQWRTTMRTSPMPIGVNDALNPFPARTTAPHPTTVWDLTWVYQIYQYIYIYMPVNPGFSWMLHFLERCFFCWVVLFSLSGHLAQTFKAANQVKPYQPLAGNVNILPPVSWTKSWIGKKGHTYNHPKVDRGSNWTIPTWQFIYINSEYGGNLSTHIYSEGFTQLYPDLHSMFTCMYVFTIGCTHNESSIIFCMCIDIDFNK